MGLKKRRTINNKEPRTSQGEVEENREENSQIQEINHFATRLYDVIEDTQFLIKFRSITGISLFFYVANWIYDIYLIYNFTIHEDYWYLSFVAAFLVNAALPIGSASYSFYNKNGDKIIPRDLLPTESRISWAMKWVCHFFFVGLFPRYYDILKYNWKCKSEEDDDKKKIYLVAMIWENAELTKLNQFHCFMKSACQLTLNLYIILTDKRDFEASSMIFPILSVIGLSFALVSYDKNICFMKGIEQGAGNNNEQNESSGITIDYNMNEPAIKNVINTNWTEMACQMSAHFFWIVSRLIALSMFMIAYGWMILLVCLVHLLGTFIWHKKNNYGHLESLGLSSLHIFAYLYPLANESDKDKRPRISPIVFQSVSIVVNIFLMLMWTFHVSLGISSDLPHPWDELTSFVLIWIVQLATMSFSCLLFWLFNKKRQHNTQPTSNDNMPPFSTCAE